LDGWSGDGALVTLRDDAGMLSYVRRLRRQGVCIVDLSLSRPDVNLPRVAGDNAAIGRMAAEHFKSKRYKNPAYFTNVFRDSEGIAPKEWRKRQHPK
jgi:LacI family transcriptional regulator